MLLNEITFDFSKVTYFSGIVASVGIGMVFVALVLLTFVYKAIPKIINFTIRRKLRKQGKPIDENKNLHIESDVNAAISLALYMYLNEIHDEESDVITIRQARRSYSPWSSKIYSTNAYHRFSQI